MPKQKIELIEPEWRPPEAKVLYDQIQAAIAKAFRLPDEVLRTPEAYQRARQRALVVTEALRDEAVRLYLEHCFPRAIFVPEE